MVQNTKTPLREDLAIAVLLGGEADAGWSGWKRDEDVFLFANTAA